jgi:hypothetical protein
MSRMYGREFLKTATSCLGALGFAKASWGAQVSAADAGISKAASAGANGIYLNQIGFQPNSSKVATISTLANSFRMGQTPVLQIRLPRHCRGSHPCVCTSMMNAPGLPMNLRSIAMPRWRLFSPHYMHNNATDSGPSWTGAQFPSAAWFSMRYTMFPSAFDSVSGTAASNPSKR